MAASDVRPIGQAEVNWDKLDKSKFYALGTGTYTGISVALYPVSLAKTRLQVSSKDSIERNAFAVIKGLLKSDGFPGIYRGLATSIIGTIPSRTIFVTLLEITKVSAFTVTEPFRLSETTQAALANGVAGMISSFVSQAVFVPFDVVSQKLMVQGCPGHTQYNGGLDVAQKVLRSDGISGLFRGFGLSVMTHTPSNAVWWASYGASQRFIWRFVGHRTEHEEHTPSLPKLMLVQGAGGIIASATSSCISNPLDTIKTRLQVGDEHRSSMKEVVKDLMKAEGWKGFYRGLGPRFISSAASGTSMVLGYEYLKRLCVKHE